MTGRFEVDYGNGWEPVSINRIRQVANANYEDAETFMTHVRMQNGSPVRLSPYSYVRYVQYGRRDND